MRYVINGFILATLTVVGCAREKAVIAYPEDVEPEAYTETTRMPMADRIVSMTRAIEIAREERPQGMPFEVNRGLPQLADDYSVSLLESDQVCVVFINAHTGEVRSTECDYADADELQELQQLFDTVANGREFLYNAAALAQANYDERTLRELDLELRDGNVWLEIGGPLEIGATSWHLDPQSGEVIGQR